MEDVKKYFSSTGLSPTDLPKALIIHECLGVSVLLAAWGGCWVVKPSKRFLSALQVRRLAEWQKAERKVEKSRLVQLVKSNKYISSKRGTELAVAFGESYFLRKLCMPLLVPLKLWLTFHLIGQGSKKVDIEGDVQS